MYELSVWTAGCRQLVVLGGATLQETLFTWNKALYSIFKRLS